MKRARTTLGLGASIACLWLAAAPPASADVEYELVIIEPWDSTYSLAFSDATGLNNLNQVSGGASTLPPGSSAEFLWTLDTGKTPINMAGRINDNGVIVKSGFIRWPDGTIQALPAPLNDPGDINNANVVAGSSGDVYVCGTTGESQAVVWDPAGSVVPLEQQFGLADADEAWAINIHNQVVGVRAWNGRCSSHEAFHLDLDSGVYTDLHALLSGGTSGSSRAFDINDQGYVVGVGTSAQGYGPFLWHPGAGFTFLPTAPGAGLLDTQFVSLNNASAAVGSAIFNDDHWRAIIWDAVNGARDLNGLVALPPDFIVDTAEQINDNGWIIGSGHYGDWSPRRAVVLVPLAPPLSGDVDRDGDVDISDLGAVLADFGCAAPPAADCPGEVDDDGDTDISDLGLVLVNFGA